MKDLFLRIITDYLELFPDEKERQSRFIEYVKNHSDEQMIDWNNFEGHVVASGFVYAKKEQKFLVIYHNDMKMYVYPGGHIDSCDKNPLEAAKREVKEETGITDIKEVLVADNELVPIDMDTQLIPYNERLDLPEHYHYDFRYLFTVDSIEEVKIDRSESSNFKWITVEEFGEDENFGKITNKLMTFERKKLI